MQEISNASYDSVIDFLNAANNDLRHKDSRSTRDEYTKTESRGRWYGADCDTGNDVQRKLRDGWQEGREKVENMLGKLDTSSLVPLDRKRRLVRSDMGDSIDMNRVYAGELDTAWTVAKRQSTRGPQRVDIVTNMICHGGEDSDVLFWRGACAIALSDKLESAGYMVRLIVGFGGEHDSTKVSCRVTVKDHGMPLDISTVSSVIIPGFFRAIGHGWIAGHTPYKCSNPGIGVGLCKVEPGEIVLSHEIRNEQTAIAAAMKIIAKINGDEQEAAA